MSYQDLYDACSKRYSGELSKLAVQQKCNEIWKDVKCRAKSKAEIIQLTELKVAELRKSATVKRAGLLNFYAQLPKRAKEDDGPSGVSSQSGGAEAEGVPVDHDGGGGDDDDGIAVAREGKSRPIVTSEDELEAPILSSHVVPKPRQDILEKEISVIESELNAMLKRRDLGMDEDGLDKKIKQMRKKLDEKKNELQKKKTKAKNMRDLRARQKTDILKLKENNPDVHVSFRSEPGRPRLEHDQPGLMEAIVDVAMHGSSAADRRRSEALRACKTLKQLSQALRDMGFSFSDSALYLRLLPRSSLTAEGKRHVSTVPVKLCRAQADLHKDHPDQHFCKSTINSLEEVASILGPSQVMFISQDDKAKVPIGKTAAKVQAPVLMHVEYKLRLSDHDFVVGERHQLTPSVYAGIVIKEKSMGRREAVSYSGPTYIAIRSAKHSGSSASTHAKDLETVFDLPDFESIVKGKDGKVKPVLMISVDGGPDENPRYSLVIKHAVAHFKKYDLDAVFVFTNAPGRSAFNRVERRMAPLSRELSGLVLPYDHYGSHLNSNGHTIDVDLEIENFQHAGETLAEIWSNMSIDDYNVKAEYIPPTENLPEVSTESQEWHSTHVRQSQYLLQIVKCDNETCCSSHRSNLRQVVYQRFLPAPYPLSQDPFKIPSPEDQTTEIIPSFLLRQTLTLRPQYPTTQEVPYDYYCPSVRYLVAGRTCATCGLYLTSIDSMKTHQRHLHPRGVPDVASRVKPLRVLSRRRGELLCVLSEDTYEWVDVESVDETEISSDELETLKDPALAQAPVIEDVSQWIEEGLPFETDVFSADD